MLKVSHQGITHNVCFIYALLSRERGSYRSYHETGFLVTVSVDDATETVVEGEVELEVRGGAGVTEYHLPQSHWSVALVNPTTHTHTHTHTQYLVRTPYILWDVTVLVFQCRIVL